MKRTLSLWALDGILEQTQRLREMTWQKVVQLSLACLFSLFAMLACTQTRSAGKHERDRAVSTLDEMYASYLSGNIVEARSNLLKGIAFIHENSVRIPELRGALPVSYARLSLLERKAGNEALAIISFEKSRYWRMIEHQKVGLKPEEIVSSYNSVTQEDSDYEVLQWDKTHSKGVGPAYLKQLKQSEP